MSDAAAFFAKKKGKKGKKKAFKFNANNVNASEVTSTIHVDAPAVSSVTEVPALSSDSISKTNDVGGGGDWGEAKVITKPTVTAATAGSVPSELMDMKALELKRSEQDDIAERIRVEETKAKLAAAREGMEKEAQRLKQAKEAKKESESSNRFGAASSSMATGLGGGGGSKWVPRHMRNTPGGGAGAGGRPSGGSRFGAAMGNVSGSGSSGYQRKVDTNDEELFPDLATADNLIKQEEEEKQQRAAAASAAAAAKARRANKPAWGGVKKETKSEAEKEVVAETTKPAPEPVKQTPTPAPATPTVPKKKVVKKKKKKDLSTFKAS